MILSVYGLRDPNQADRNLDAMAGDPIQRRRLADILPMMMESIYGRPIPTGVNHWERMLRVSPAPHFSTICARRRACSIFCVISAQRCLDLYAHSRSHRGVLAG